MAQVKVDDPELKKAFREKLAEAMRNGLVPIRAGAAPKNEVAEPPASPETPTPQKPGQDG